MLPSRIWLLLAVGLPVALGQVRRQDASSSEMEALAAALPACGLSCVETGLASSQYTDVISMCTDLALENVVTACVVQSCAIIDALSTKNITTTACGVVPRDDGPAYDILNIVLGVITAFVVLLRFGHRIFIVHTMPTMDDWCILGCICIGVPGTVLTSIGTIKNGLGRDIWTLTPDQITSFAFWFYHIEWTYFLNLCLLKMSLLFFYLKIFPGRGVRMLLWGTVAYNVAWGGSFILLSVFQCTPISYYWTKWDNVGSGVCLNSNSIGWANGITSIVLDVWMLAIPLAQLRTLQLHFKKKIGVAIMFCTGTFVTVISIIRLDALSTFASSTNPTMDNLAVSQWSTIEVNIGIICACMPTLRLLLLKVFPALSSNSAAYGGYDHNKSGRSWGDKSSDPRSRGGAAGGYTDVGRPAITYQRSYTVHYNDAAEEPSTSQVHLNDLDRKGFEANTNVSECSA